MRLSLAVVGLVFVAISAPVGAQTSTGIERLAWLQGCWAMTSGARTVEEQWMAPRAGSMLGMGRTTRDNKLVEYELVVVREQGSQLVYEAHPSGQASTTFTSRVISASRVEFENPKHDFPQVVAYQQDQPDSLLAWIEGTQAGKIARVEFRYARVACGGVK